MLHLFTLVGSLAVKPFLVCRVRGVDPCSGSPERPKRTVSSDAEAPATYECRLQHPSSCKHILGHAKRPAMNPKSKCWRRYLHVIRKMYNRETYKQCVCAWNQHGSACNYADTRGEVKHTFFVYAASGHDRSYIVDCGSSLRLVRVETLGHGECMEIRLSETVALNTAEGQVEARWVTDIHVIRLGIYVEAHNLQGVPPVLS